ncbi:hypothetical protein [Candidatus Tisiphia endosymbiont of Ditula angustiorana]|uniref:hypothetical protein n=1 Tax=Candidatus Tisiphia endosymbiont of Ditula angustiorana TaxID=3066272 RepID=UPI00312C8AE5
MFKVFHKKSSPDKSSTSIGNSATLGRNSSLRSTGNDTSTDPILDAKLKIKFQSFQDMLETLEKHGDIVLLKEYKDLYEDIQKSELSATNKNLLLFKICEDKAGIAWQKGKFSTHEKSLKKMFSIDVPSAIIALEHWYVEYVKYEKNINKEANNINKKAKDCIKNIRELYTESISTIKTEVNSLLQDKKYGEAVKKLEYLTAHSNSFHISAIHAQIFIKQGDDLVANGKTSEAKECYEKAYQDCKSKLSIDKDVPYYVIHDTFKVLEGKLTVVGNTKLAAEAATYASKYKPNLVKILIEQGDDLAAAGKTSEAKKCYEKAYQDCKSKLSKDKDVPYDVIHDTFKVLEDKLSIVGDTKLAAEAASYASKYNPNASAVPPVNPKIKQLEKTLVKVVTQIETVRTLDEQNRELEKLEAQHKAALEEVKAQHKAALEALRTKASPTKDTKVDGVGDSSIPSAPPSYDYIAGLAGNKYLQLAKNAPTASIAEVVTPLASEVLAEVVPPLAPEVLAELTELAKLISSLDYRNSNYGPTKDKAKKLLNEVVKENPDVYKTIDDPKILVLLADVLFSLNDVKVARIVCEKALKSDSDIWKATNDQIVLLNLAGVLLSSSNESKAKEVYSKAISIRIYSKDERGSYIIDSKGTTIVSKTVAQDQYTDAERECLVKVCLSASKLFQKVQALDCYPHTYVTKRHDIAVQLKQSAKQVSELNCGLKAYALYLKAYSVLKDDQELLKDITALHNTHHLEIDPKYPNPPTEASTDLMGVWCANSDY